MKIRRIDFIKSLVLFPFFLSTKYERDKPYVLQADGKTCDVDALHAWMQGKPVYYTSGEQVGYTIENCKLYINDTLYFDNCDKKSRLITGCHIKFGPNGSVVGKRS